MNLLDGAYLVAAAATAPWWARKSRGGWAERFGRVADPPAPPGPAPRVMVHAVSVGEAASARVLVEHLARSAEVIVTTTTDTGLARARQLYSPLARVVRYPADASWSVRRFLDAVRPDAVGLIELEVWPNFIAECRRRGTPVGVVGGRLSARSFRGYRRVRRWIGPSFGSLAFVAAQDEAYAGRFVEMGVPADRVSVTGSMKWDAARVGDTADGADDLAREMGIDRSRPLVVAGSTGPGEERLLDRAIFGAGPAGAAGVQLLCAPRKPDRFDRVASELPGCVRRTAGRVAGPGGGGRFLLDTLGELRAAYALADVVVVGRTFADMGGSDPIEPAALGKPVVAGPSVANFETVVALLERSGGLVRATAGSVGAVLDSLLRDPDRRRAMGETGRACVVASQGASGRNAGAILAAAGPVAARRGGPGAGRGGGNPPTLLELPTCSRPADVGR